MRRGLTATAIPKLAAQQTLSAAICPIPKLIVCILGNGRHERISDLTSIGAEPLDLGQHASLVPARANSLAII